MMTEPHFGRLVDASAASSTRERSYDRRRRCARRGLLTTRLGRAGFLGRPHPALGRDGGDLRRLRRHLAGRPRLRDRLATIILPSPWETALELVVVGQNLLTGGYLLAAFWVTTQEVAIGFAIAVVLGVHARHDRRRNLARRACGAALSRRDRHDAESRLRAALHLLARLRHLVEGRARRVHRDVSGRGRNRGRPSRRRRECPHALPHHGRQPLADAGQAEDPDRACRTSSPA